MKNSKLGRFQQMRFALSMMRDSRLPFWMRAIIPVATLIYVVSPIDLIPDFIAGFGQIDDIVVVITAISLLASFLRKVAPSDVVADHLSTLFSRAQPQTVRVNQEPDIIDVEYRVVHRDQR